MTIKLRCDNPDCEELLRLKDDLAGKRIKCPQCGHKLRVPEEDEEEEDREEEEPRQRPKKRSPNRTRSGAESEEILNYRRDARNTIWLGGVLASVPMMIRFAMMLLGGTGQVRWDAMSITLAAYSSIVALLAVVVGILCGQGKKVGRTLAFVVGALLLPSFPIGTFVGIGIMVKVSKQGFVDYLE